MNILLLAATSRVEAVVLWVVIFLLSCLSACVILGFKSVGKLRIGIIGNHLFLDRDYILVWPWETLHCMDKQYLDDGGRIYHFNTMDGKKVAYSLSGALEVQVKKLTAETVRARLDLCEEYQVALSLKRIVDDHIKRLRLKDLKPHFNLHWTDTAPLHDPAGVYWTGHVRLINAAIIPKTFSGGSELEHFTSQDGYQVGIGWEWTAKLVDTSAARLLSGNHNTEAIEAVVKQTLAEWVSLTPLSNLIEAVAGPKVFERHPITTQLEEDPLLWHISIRLTPKIEIVGPEPPETSDPEEEITAAEAEA